MKPYGHKIGADSNWGVGKQENAVKGRARAESRDEIKSDVREMLDGVDLPPSAEPCA